MVRIISRKIRFLLLITILIVLGGYEIFRDKTTEVINLNLQPRFAEIHHEYFMVKNPPENIDSIVTFFNKEVARAPEVLKASKWEIDTTSFYGHDYYEERLFFDRTYKVPRYFWERVFDHHDIRYGTTHQEDVFIRIIFKTDDFVLEKDLRVTFPYLVIYKKKYIYVYCPNGFKNSKHRHWSITRRSNTK